MNPETQWIYLSFNFNGLFNTVTTGIYYKDSVYIPVSAVLKQLEVDQVLNMSSKTIEGFYIKSSDKYEIDFNTGTATIGGKTIEFDTSNVIVGPLDFYVLPSFFRKIFDLNFSVDFSSLSLLLNTNQELPIVRDYQREMRRNYMLVSPQSNLAQAPLEYPRRRHLLDGGVMDYSLSAFKDPNQSVYNYQLTGGAEILGGETEGGLYGTVTNGTSALYSSDIRWKYAFDSTAYITYAGLGNLYSDGLTQYGFRGAQVSNEPLTVRTLFSQYIVNARTKPGWDVELYLNGELVGYKRADAQGRAQFSIPLVYGTTYIQIKYYGPNGQFREEDRRLQIPFTFVPTGQFNYTVSAGKLNNTDYNFLSVNAIYGFSDWMTDKVGLDYVNSPLFSKPLLYNSLSLRFGPEYMMSIDAAPLAFYRSTFSALYPSQAGFDLSYEHYAQNLLYNPSSLTQEAQADAYLPFSIGDNSINFRVAGNAQQYVSGQKSYSYSAYLSTSVSQLNASIGYLRSIIEYGNAGVAGSYSLTGSVLYSLFFQQGPFDFLNGTLVDVTGRYGVLKNSLDDISFQLSRNIQQYIRIALSADRDYISRTTTFSLQIIADLPVTRSTSSVQVQNGDTYYSENLSGSIGFDNNYGRFLFNDLPWVGHSAASIRMFVDANGNGKYDKGEEVIRNGSVTLRQAVASETSRGGIIRDWNLLPYTQYSADVDLSTIRNPLWIPKEKSFSFVTDPNSYKRIDVPFFVGGVVEGNVLRLVDGRLTSVAGLSLEISSKTTDLKKTIAVFNDGSFYYMGLPPGEYEARVDSAQLSVLGVYADPAVLDFTVRPTKNGDFVEGLRIVLKSVKQLAAPPVVRTAPAPVKTEAPGEKYVVQIGAFVSTARAEKLAKRARILTGQILETHFSPRSGLYVVQTDTFESRQTAVHRLDVFINKFGLFDAFINSTVESRAGYLFRVQLGAFRSMSAALRFVSRIRRETGSSAIVEFNMTSRLFTVMCGPFKSESAAENAAEQLRRRSDCRNAYVVIDGESDLPRRYTIVLGNFESDHQARRFASDFRWQTGKLALVGFDSERLEFRVFTPTFKTEQEAETALEEIRTYSGYQSAYMLSLP